MSTRFRKILQAHRPENSSGRMDKYLPEIAADLRRRVVRAMDDFEYETLVLDDDGIDYLSALLVEFAEDLHSDAGLWRSLEKHNRDIFQTPLPFFVEHGDTSEPLTTFDERRVGFFLWTIYQATHEGLILNPDRKDLRALSQELSAFFETRLAPVPKDSGVANYLATPNTEDWIVKRKLVWLGTKSFLFRPMWDAANQTGHESRYLEIEAIDHFICTACTQWSGLGPNEILAEALDLTDEDRSSLRSWSERHTAIYRILEVHGPAGNITSEIVRNEFSGCDYTIRVDNPTLPFAAGQLFFGTLLPWRGEWVWSGIQRKLGPLTESDLANQRDEFLEKYPHLAFRFRPENLEKAREAASKYHDSFVAHHGSDLVEFPDGLSMAAAEQARLRKMWASQKPDLISSIMKKTGLTKPEPEMEFPGDLLDNANGVAVFSNPVEGLELFKDFNDLKSALRKRSLELDEFELDSIRNAMESPVISPAFLRRLAKEFGGESFTAFYFLDHHPLPLALDFLLRRHKGSHFRTRYPAISLLD
jgi:hypothetical protein